MWEFFSTGPFRQSLGSSTIWQFHHNWVERNVYFLISEMIFLLISYNDKEIERKLQRFFYFPTNEPRVCGCVCGCNQPGHPPSLLLQPLHSPTPKWRLPIPARGDELITWIINNRGALKGIVLSSGSNDTLIVSLLRFTILITRGDTHLFWRGANSYKYWNDQTIK